MRERIQKIWKDPVGSKIVANLIWIILLALGTTIYLFYQKLHLSISFDEAWDRLLLTLDREKVITNRYYVMAFLVAVLLLVNRKVILKILGVVIKAALGIREYHHKYEYNFTNQGKRSTGVISNERSLNNFKIKPLYGTKDWSLKILFSHSYSALETEEGVTETTRIYKKYAENILMLESYQQNESKEKKIVPLLNNYIDQEFELQFNLSHEKGGIILKTKRHDKELHTTKVKYGCSYFKIVAEESNFDFDLKIYYERLE